ncbi:MAG TPA: hypothetical protein VK716_18565 [Terracidiphilus sp.]|jgi:hypothetical protein|nr:hypothetical protein [Terracidiphilus sp.]
MNDDALDRMLAGEDELLPSSGFVSAVMDRVRAEAVAPAPIPFPWKRVLPGLVVVGAGLCWGGVELVRLSLTAIHTNAPAQISLPAISVQALQATGWAALALGAALVSWVLSRRIARDSGLI